MTLRRFGSVALASCALANVIFLEQWEDLLRVRDPNFSYYVTALSSANYFALMADVALLGFVGAALAQTVASNRRPEIRWAAILAIVAGFFMAANAVRREMSARLPLSVVQSAMEIIERLNHAVFALLAVVLVLGAGFLVVASPSRFRAAGSIVRGVGLTFSPFLLFTFGSAVWILATFDLNRAFGPAPLAPRAHNGQPTAVRFVVLVFDEADYHLMFEARPPDLNLPEFDRLRRESLFATNALPPANETDISLAAYITGRNVRSLRPLSSRDAVLHFADQPGSSRFSADPQLFTRARTLGANIALVGWGHPYCRIFAYTFAACHSRGLSTPPTNLFRTALWYAAEAFTVGPFLDRAYGVGPSYHTLDYLDLMGAAKRLIGAAEYDFIFIHLPIPHEPRIYNRRNRTFVGPQRHTRDGYVDNLALADVALGQLRSALSRSGQADRTALLVTSDHPYRLGRSEAPGSDERVPFLVRLPQMPQPIDYRMPFNTVMLGDITVAMLDGRIQSVPDVISLIDRTSR